MILQHGHDAPMKRLVSDVREIDLIAPIILGIIVKGRRQARLSSALGPNAFTGC